VPFEALWSAVCEKQDSPDAWKLWSHIGRTYQMTIDLSAILEGVYGEPTAQSGVHFDMFVMLTFKHTHGDAHREAAFNAVVEMNQTVNRCHARVQRFLIDIGSPIVLTLEDGVPKTNVLMMSEAAESLMELLHSETLAPFWRPPHHEVCGDRNSKNARK
jgi:hypothetical protein